MLIKNTVIVSCVLGYLMAVLVACVPSDDKDVTPVPTQVLVMLTPTPTPVVPTATPTVPPPPGPADVLPTAVSANLAGLETDEERLIAQLALADLSQSQQLPLESILVNAVIAIRRDSAELDCSPPQDAQTVDSFPGFRVILTANAVVYDYHADDAATVQLCNETPVDDATGDILLLVDPVAFDMFSLTQRRLAQELDLPMRRIQLVEMQAVDWPDSSLGCPMEGQVYAQMLIDGYRMVVSVGDEEYIFHTDFDRPTLCAPENEVLPKN